MIVISRYYMPLFERPFHLIQTVKNGPKSIARTFYAVASFLYFVCVLMGRERRAANTQADVGGLSWVINW
jgi:hypothetical protein